MTKSPVPRFDLLDLKKYLTVTIQFTRGCPYQCGFCDIPAAYGRRPRTKKPAQVIAELETLYRLGWRGRVMIADDNFIGNHHAALELVHELVRWQKNKKYPFEFSTEAYIDLSQRVELMDAMVEANFLAVFLGIETPSVEALRETKKYQNLRRNPVDQIRDIQSHGLWVLGGFIVGFDSDGESIFQSQEEFIRRAAVPCCAMNLLQAIPTTPLYERMKSQGRLIDADPVFMVPNDRPNFKTVMPPDDLLSGTSWLLRNIYDPAQYFERSIRSIEYWKPVAPQHFSRISLSNAIRWILRSVWIQGVRSGYRRAYWRFWAGAIKRWWRDRTRLEQACVMLNWAHHLFPYYGAMADNLEADRKTLALSTRTAAPSLRAAASESRR